ncbi:phosphotriesterase family protein [Agromyces aerolatus]|uniref:phosphotriesterase family protein n=1 Tax=Agromyces sp. LY-1074 TaxID=3074080 RepID=UPI00285E7E7F|nr:MULTISPECIES: hypothetical protein [unclassified Agromyces]MDR5701665.1 hypothetical protein [Agromyces sp. LY-1074]MDR5707895.1 hypothetical protein [Agromyces sp. LY-1358]
MPDEHVTARLDDHEVVTVLGTIPATELGMTLTHEHLLMNWMKENRLNGLLADIQLMSAELEPFAAAGGRTVVELTSMGIGRDPQGLAEIARRTGLNIVMGTGFYREPYLDPGFVNRKDASAIAEWLELDIREGADGTGIRPGIIGEVGQDGPVMTAMEERTFRAAGLAQLATGLTISTHAARWPNGLPQLDLLDSLGVDPGRVIIGHADTVPSSDYHLELARRGAFVQFDTLCIAMRQPFELDKRIEYVLRMLDAGHVDRLLLSHDVCVTDHLSVYGGGGFGYLTSTFLPALRDHGVSDDDIDRITVQNPARALTGA